MRLDSAVAENDLQSKLHIFRSPKDLYAFVDVDEKYELAESPRATTTAGGWLVHFGWRISSIRSYLENNRRTT
jgi:hypothetical protein